MPFTSRSKHSVAKLVRTWYILLAMPSSFSLAYVTIDDRVQRLSTQPQATSIEQLRAAFTEYGKDFRGMLMLYVSEDQGKLQEQERACGSGQMKHRSDVRERTGLYRTRYSTGSCSRPLWVLVHSAGGWCD
ncbi:uncharacterized protein M421DRAFT_278117 [Didymella exigua CBS 183.55]|uniref:Uncharacterized protein n=1 Tax=Didymella exigua CBS 183.55 TaxID=1150837 RepID=A0A6A5RBA0_9PLEO|nr:uncharacterized protein M421DRAFT_278117 [Didymella exigua CBS 183.55]KAF1924619.1 hypothetical protein M421DRAFT_278117 [Didymella exigua CBS 183.55]